LAAATIISCSISTSPATSGSILTASRFFCPSICTDTIPPPAAASTRIWAISCWIFSCTCCIWRIFCCMLPGIFMCLLLEISDFVDLTVEHFAEALHFGVGERTAGGFVFLGLGTLNGSRDRLGRFFHADFDAHGAIGDLPDGLLQLIFAECKL